MVLCLKLHREFGRGYSRNGGQRRFQFQKGHSPGSGYNVLLVSILQLAHDESLLRVVPSQGRRQTWFAYHFSLCNRTIVTSFQGSGTNDLIRSRSLYFKRLLRLILFALELA
jgi:hypothetical protein